MVLEHWKKAGTMVCLSWLTTSYFSSHMLTSRASSGGRGGWYYGMLVMTADSLLVIAIVDIWSFSGGNDGWY